MNSLFSRKHRYPSKNQFLRSRDCTKVLRRNAIQLQFALRGPRQFIAAVSLIVLISLALFFRISLRGYMSRSLYLRHDGIPYHPSQDGTNFALSHQACERQYDQAWRVMHDDGRQDSNKTFAEIAYFIQVGSDSVALLPRLFQRIHHPRHVFILHIDAKVDRELRAEVSKLLSDIEEYSANVHIMESEMVTYKAISMVTNTIGAMTLALEKHPTWDYFINLSGADYPLVTPENQAWLLARPRVPVGRLNFISFFPKKEWVPYSFRIRNMHWDPASTGYQSARSRLHLMRGHKTNPLERHRGFVFTKAEAWMILSRPFVQFVVRSSFAKRMLINHLHVLSVPEHYFADVLYNHPFWRDTIVPDALRRVVWYLRNRRSGQHPYVLDKGSSILTFWEYIEETRSLFARKFSVPDSLLLEKIDAEMSGAGLNESSANWNEHRMPRRVFLQRIVDHFDDMTQKTLNQQRYSWPKSAYPTLES